MTEKGGLLLSAYGYLSATAQPDTLPWLFLNARDVRTLNAGEFPYM